MALPTEKLTVRLDEVLVTHELWTRPAPPPDRETELAAMRRVAHAALSGPDAALQAAVDSAVVLCDAGSAGVSVLDERADAFSWVAMSGAYAALAGGSTPGRFSPCGTALDRGSPQLYARPERCFTYLQNAAPPLVEGLVVPFRADGVAGTIWVAAHDEVRKFTAEDARLLGTLADFAAAAAQSLASCRDEARRTRVFDTTLSSIADFAYVFDRDGRFAYVNKALLDLWGLSLQQAVGRNFFDLNYPPDLAARLQRQIEEVFETGRPVTDETPYTSPTGADGHYEYIFRPVLAVDGTTVEAVAGSTRDITRRKRADSEREALRSSLEAERAKLAEIIERAPAFICTLRGPDHVFEIANERYYDIVGRRDIIGKPVRQALPEVEGQGFFELLDNVYHTGKTFAGDEMPVLLRRGRDESLQQRYMNFVYQPLRDEGGGICGIFVHGVDVTDMVRAREAARNGEAQLRLIADAMPQIVWVTRPDGYHEYYNRRWYEYLGLDFEQTKGAGWAEPLHPDDRERARARWAHGRWRPARTMRSSIGSAATTGRTAGSSAAPPP